VRKRIVFAVLLLSCSSEPPMGTQELNCSTQDTLTIVTNNPPPWNADADTLGVQFAMFPMPDNRCTWSAQVIWDPTEYWLGLFIRGHGEHGWESFGGERSLEGVEFGPDEVIPIELYGRPVLLRISGRAAYQFKVDLKERVLVYSAVDREY